MKNKNKAFTLVEIVLAMAIIGVVAVLTITNATKDTDEATKVAQLRSTYNILNTGYTKMTLEGDAWLPNLVDHIKVSKLCRKDGTDITTNGDGCFNEDAKSIGGVELDDRMANGTKAILSNGASIWLNYTDQLYVDVNGPNKGNNIIGDDVFHFSVGQSINPSGGPDYPFSMSPDDYACPYYGDDCTAWVIKMGNMEYLKCPEKLSWTEVGKSTCNQ